MDFVDRVLRVYPGEVKVTRGVIRIHHSVDHISHFYPTRHPTEQSLPRSIRPVFEQFDGIDLFSSTFKICSDRKPVVRGGVTIITSLSSLRTRMSLVKFPEPAIPFMNETGNWIYAASTRSSTIFRFDVEYGTIDRCRSLIAVLEGWRKAIAG